MVSGLVPADPAELLFWSGAGVSGDAPTSGPLGNQLTDRAIGEAFDDELLDLLRQTYSALNLQRDRPRLESVLEVVVSEHGSAALAALLDSLRNPPPNGNHRFFAQHTRRGGGHITANFDTCIERAGGDPTKIVHFHGSLSGTEDVEELGARLSGIERGFNHAQRESLDHRIAAASVIVVVGYSGLDYFDVDPYWRDAAERGMFSDRRVVWLDHSIGWGLLIGSACARKQLRMLADVGGADVYEVNAPTREVLNSMATAWHLPSIPSPPRAAARPSSLMAVSSAAKAHATTRFLVSVGLRGVVRQRLSAHPLNVEEHSWAADAAWGAGQYREAARHWAAAYPDDDPASTARRRERKAACLWLRGQLRAARKLLVETLDQAAEERVDPLTRLLIAETLARVLTHMQRLPDTRRLATRSQMSSTARMLDEIEQDLLKEADGRTLPIHLRARVISARANLTRQPLPASGHVPVRDFDESEALGAMLNYQHAALRARVEQPRDGDGGPPARWEYLRHCDRFRALGDTADAARVPLLPGAASAFSLATVARGLASCDFTPYHFSRLMAIYLVQRLRERAAAPPARTDADR